LKINRGASFIDKDLDIIEVRAFVDLGFKAVAHPSKLKALPPTPFNPLRAIHLPPSLSLPHLHEHETETTMTATTTGSGEDLFPETIHIDNFFSAVSHNDAVPLDLLVQLFDADRFRSVLERFFTPPALANAVLHTKDSKYRATHDALPALGQVESLNERRARVDQSLKRACGMADTIERLQRDVDFRIEEKLASQRMEIDEDIRRLKQCISVIQARVQTSHNDDVGMPRHGRPVFMDADSRSNEAYFKSEEAAKFDTSEC